MMLWSGGTVEQQDEAEIDSMCLRNRVPATQEKANTTPSDENEREEERFYNETVMPGPMKHVPDAGERRHRLNACGIGCQRHRKRQTRRPAIATTRRAMNNTNNNMKLNRHARVDETSH